MIGPFPSVVVRVVSILLSPFIMLFGVYVTVEGHYGPGGGFAGGVVAGVGIILLRATIEPEVSYRVFPAKASLVIAALGVLGFAACGFAPVLAGGAFLDYGQLAVQWLDPAELRYYAILVVELAVAMAVFGTMVLLFDVLAGRGP